MMGHKTDRGFAGEWQRLGSTFTHQDGTNLLKHTNFGVQIENLIKKVKTNTHPVPLQIQAES